MSKLKQQFQNSAREFESPRTIAVVAVLIALNLALDALNIRIQLTPQLRIGFSFLTRATAGMLFGPVVAMTAGAAADFLGWLVNNGGGVYFPGFTLTAVLAGMIWGIALYQKPLRWYRVLAAKFSINIFLNIFLNSFWLYLYYGKSFQLATLPLRIGKNLVLLPLEVLMTVLLGRFILKINQNSSYQHRKRR